ncbi:MAG: ABC transporter permease [Alistipes sp.]|nr:ABC transporter permease [Alistipes sp.]MDE7344036.1 ABC transporter permease [Alistipes sp.]
MLPFFFARRYFFASASRSVVHLISGLSVVAVAVPVAAMIILLSVFNGFEALVRQNCSAFDADLTVSPREGQTFAVADLDTAALSRVPGVGAWSFFLEQSVLLERGGRQAAAVVRGVDDRYGEVFPFRETVTAGSPEVRLGDLERLVVGQTMAYMLGIRSLADAEVGLYAVRRGSFSSLLPVQNFTRRTVPVGGAFTVDLESERSRVLASLRLAQELFARPGRVSAVAVALVPGADAERTRAAVAQAVGERFRVQTRYQMRASFYRIMTYEKWGVFFISLLVLVVASFSVVGALAMLIVDKRDDIRTLAALGADRSVVRRIFRTEGLFICGAGALCGLAVGVGLSLAQQYFGFIEIPAESFLTKSYPVEFRFGDLLAVAAAFSAVAFCLSNITVRSMIVKTS